nr:type I pullulanase [Gammaproteobacteria bacterium]
YTLKSTETFAYDNMYQVEVKFTDSNNSLTKNVSITQLFDAAFDEAYYYDGELGAIYTSEKTTFKVWSPVSKKIELNIYDNGTPVAVNAEKGNDSKNTFQMTKGEKGVFSYELSGDVEGVYYTYTVYNAQYPNGYEVVDPYAKSTGVNGLRGMVVDFSKTNPDGWNSVQALNIKRTGMVIYELHVADLTSSTTWGGSAENAKKYLGLIEKGTTYTKGTDTVSTGFDHIRELGVNAVQLLPIFDQANDETNPVFNWGYNPLNYNTLEGVYSSDPYDGYARIIEFKKVVQAYNKAGINIIMDVVYNHVNGAVRSNFDCLMPGYYFRYQSDGSLYNGSGCGNETASDHLMFRKFMIDSTTFWLGEYKLGGFRFDLMGLHDIETMDKLVVECEKVNPNAVIFGEPWTGGTSGLQSSKQAVQDNERSFVGFGAFNDKIRDELVKGGLSDKSALSWISNTQSGISTNFDALAGGIKGNTVKGTLVLAGPDKSITYATCHDNYTLSDRFKAAGVYAPDVNKKMSMLANAIVLTSQGTSFILSGEEFLRTKGGNSNSYNASYKINELDYSLKIKNYDMFLNYCQLILMKINFATLHLTDTSELNVIVSEGRSMISYKLESSESDFETIVIHKNGLNEETTYDLTGYTIYLDTLGLLKDTDVLGVETINPFQTIVAIKAK